MGYENCRKICPTNVGYSFFLQKLQSSYQHEVAKKASPYCLIANSLKLIYLLFMTGIRDHRSAIELMYALEHIESMRSRMDTSGCPQEYTYEELRHLLVEESGYGFEDFERVLEEHCKTNGL